MKQTKQIGSIVSLGMILVVCSLWGNIGCSGAQTDNQSPTGSESDRLSVPDSMKDVLTSVCPSRLASTSEASSSGSSSGSFNNFNNNSNNNSDCRGNNNCVLTSGGHVDSGIHSSVSNLILSAESNTVANVNNGTNYGTIGNGGQRNCQCTGSHCPSPTSCCTTDSNRNLICDSGTHERTTPNTSSNNSTQALSEQDEGNIIGDGTKLNAKNIVGILHVEPSTDGKVSWAARKWVYADTKENADAAMKDIKITSTTDKGEAQVIVDHPSGQSSLRYETCVVVKAPAEWIENLRNDLGVLEVLAHGTGAITAKSLSGIIDVETQSTGIVDINSETGIINLKHSGSGPDKIETKSGSIDVETQSTGIVDINSETGIINLKQSGSGAVTLQTTSGSIDSTLYQVSSQADSLINSETGSIMLNLSGSLATNLNAQVTTGSISVPSGFPQPTTVNTTGASLVGRLNGGGSTLTLRSNTGSILIDASGSFVSTRSPN